MRIQITEGPANVLFEDRVNYIIQISDNIPLQFGGASVYRSTVQAIPNAAYTIVSFDTELFDIGGTYWLSASPTRLIVTKPGYYLVIYNYYWAVNNTGIREARLYHNGNTRALDTKTALTGVNTSGILSVILDCDADDYFEAVVWQNSGGSLELSPAYNRFSAAFLGPS